MKNFYKNKKILVTGGTGMIGVQLVKMLSELKCDLSTVSLEKNNNLPKKVKQIKLDLRNFDNCLKVTKNIDFVFHLAGIKGSPKLTQTRPYSFMTPMVLFNFNMFEACRINKVKRYLYTSSVGVYKTDKLMKENSVWKTFPSINDWYSGWAKRIGELQLEAFSKEFQKKPITTIVRPANVYGPYDNFDKTTAMVIPSLINKFCNSKNKKVVVWGDGSAIRDFIFSKDVAFSMMKLMYKMPNKPINIGSGKGVKIKDLVNLINKYFNNSHKIVWDKNKPSGDKIRILDTKELKKLNCYKNTNLEIGLKETIEWYLKNKNKFKRFDNFK
ncbi:MAG: hypothetical protein CBE33_04115 [Candidatus Pelagibacter sp. TMED273]|nr:MAG: hypothetical protein CBE33_04115 [Candidatus Pelagibacter sp. TMED273]|tara:strand:- start:2164 stop:3144 length:981 start_codon:yes stop_codon:yes gene_type:complete